MMRNDRCRLLLIADTSSVSALGSKFIRGIQEAGFSEDEVKIIYSSPAQQFSPSMGSLAGKIFYRLADKRSLEWWGFQRELVRIILQERPQWILVTGILPLSKKVFNAINDIGGLVANYLTDDPWNKIHRRRLFIKNLLFYNHVFSTKKALAVRLSDYGVRSTSWLPFAYDPYIHHECSSDANLGADVVFIGTGAHERLKWLRKVGNISGISRKIFGNSWKGLQISGWDVGASLEGEDYCKAISSSKVTIGLLREANGDMSTDRSYEIGAIGGCGIYQDTSEHRDLLRDYPEVGFFKTPDELEANIKLILADKELQRELREKGLRGITEGKNTYADRMVSIRQWFEGNR
jgi:spore maturation protein CgeB